MKITKWKTSKIKLAPYNPRKMTADERAKLKRSIEEFGYVEPIIVNKRTGHVVGGNQRLIVLKELGVEEIDVVEVDLSLLEEKALNVALNKISGEWDFEKLNAILKELTESFDATLTGFDLDELEVLTESLPEANFDYIQEEEEPNKEHASREQEGIEKGIEEGSIDVATENVSYVVYLSFPSKERAEAWLEENGYEQKFKPGTRTMVIRVE